MKINQPVYLTCIKYFAYFAVQKNLIKTNIMKLKLLSLAFFGLILFGSCSKEYTCECKSVITQPGETPMTSVSDQTFKEKSTKKAKKACESTASSSFMGMTTTTTCKLK